MFIYTSCQFPFPVEQQINWLNPNQITHLEEVQIIDLTWTSSEASQMIINFSQNFAKKPWVLAPTVSKSMGAEAPIAPTLTRALNGDNNNKISIYACVILLIE